MAHTQFPMTTAEVVEAHQTQEGRGEIGRKLEAFYRANGMRAGRNHTTGELLSEAMWWAATARAEA